MRWRVIKGIETDVVDVLGLGTCRNLRDLYLSTGGMCRGNWKELSQLIDQLGVRSIFAAPGTISSLGTGALVPRSYGNTTVELANSSQSVLFVVRRGVATGAFRVLSNGI